MIFPLLSLLLPLSLWSSSAEALVNVKVERQIDVTSLAVKTSLAINFKGVGKTYQFVLPKDVSEGLADITFRHRDQLLPSDQLASQKCPEKHVCWNIHVNDKRQFTATYSTISQLKPHPSKDVALEDPLKLKLVTSQYYPSVYETQEETTFFRLLETCTILALHCQDANVEKGTCGPYLNTSYPKDSDVRAKLHFKAVKFSALVVSTWTQDFVVLPWFSQVLVNEHLHIRNTAAPYKHNNSFRRHDLLQLLHASTTQGHPLEAPVYPAVPLDLPYEATGLTVRDEIGIVWTTRRQERQVGQGRWVTDVAPRYPLANGWGATLQLSYRLPQGSVAKIAGGRVTLKLDIGRTMALESPIHAYRLCIILPEDAEYPCEHD